MDAGIAPGPPGNAMAGNAKGEKGGDQESVEEKDEGGCCLLRCDCDAPPLRRNILRSLRRRTENAGVWGLAILPTVQLC